MVSFKDFCGISPRKGKFSFFVTVFFVFCGVFPAWGSDIGSIMQGVRGCALVMDLSTGEIVEGYNTERALSFEYPSSSILKPVVALGALLYGVVTPEEEVRGNREELINQYGRGLLPYMRTDRGALSLDRAMAVSDNIYFYTIGARLGEKAVRVLYESFNIGRPTGLEPKQERAGRLPKAVKGNNKLHFLGWGGKSTRLTAAQMMVMMGCFGNGGEQLRPFFKNSGKSKKVVARIKAPREFSLVRRALREVVLDGTGKGANIPDCEVYGKTGSIDMPGTRVPLGVFIGFTQGLHRDVAFAAVVEGSYSSRAVSLVGKILESLEDVESPGED